VARYPTGTPRRWVSDLIDQLTRCAGTAAERYRLIAADYAGPGTVLLTREWDDGDHWSAYFLGATDRYLVVVLETGVEFPAGDPTIASGIGQLALQRANTCPR
jgi:hypothetical protein